MMELKISNQVDENDLASQDNTKEGLNERLEGSLINEQQQQHENHRLEKNLNLSNNHQPTDTMSVGALNLPHDHNLHQPSHAHVQHHTRNLSNGNSCISFHQVQQVPSLPKVQTTKRQLFKKKSSVADHIYGVLGFHSKNEEGKTEFTTREIGTLIMIAVLLMLFMMSVTGFFIMWFTEAYNNSITSKLVLANNSEIIEYWKSPPLNTLLKVHIYNYTNYDRFLSGKDHTLKVKDLGPYTYKENSTKVDVIFNRNKTITYRDKRSYTFVPELSNGRQYDRVSVPNVPFLTAASTLKYENKFSAMVQKYVITASGPSAFVHLAADSLLWGYDDPIFDLKKGLSSSEKFGLLANRNGTSQDRYSIFNGEDDIRKLALISEFNGKSSMNFWSTKECNQVDGTDGSQFPPHYMDKKHKLEVFLPAMCRKLPLVFDTEVSVFGGVPAWRYKTPLNVLAEPDINPENQCYCHLESGSCAPSGVFNGTLCFDAPIFVSFPHFFTANPQVYSHLEGIEPNASKHQTFADIHPRLAFPVDGASRLQINIQIQGKKNFKELDTFLDEMILPVVWVEVTSGEINDELRALIYHGSFSANAIQLTLRYGTLLSVVTTLGFLLAGCYYRKRVKESYLKENLSLEQINKDETIKPILEEPSITTAN